MANVEQLAKKFEEAGLRVRTAQIPDARRQRDQRLFRMGIDRKVKGTRVQEQFWIEAPEGTRAEVMDVDKSKKQLTLLVHEPARTFTETVQTQRLSDIPAGVRILRQDALLTTIELKTPAQKRHFLVGMDERSYFISQAPTGTTAGQVRKALKARNVKDTEESTRQGEWFFVPLSVQENKDLNAKISAGGIIVLKKSSIDQRTFGNPHIADEVARVTRFKVRKVEVRRRDNRTKVRDQEVREPISTQVWVRGKIRHRDHATIELHGWHRVERNSEVSDRGRMAGIAWVD